MRPLGELADSISDNEGDEDDDWGGDACNTSDRFERSPRRTSSGGPSPQLSMLISAIVHDSSKWHDDAQLIPYSQVQSRNPSLLPGSPTDSLRSSPTHLSPQGFIESPRPAPAHQSQQGVHPHFSSGDELSDAPIYDALGSGGASSYMEEEKAAAAGAGIRTAQTQPQVRATGANDQELCDVGLADWSEDPPARRGCMRCIFCVGLSSLL